MRHPFDGILEVPPTTEIAPTGNRRGFLARLVAAVVAIPAALIFGRSAEAQSWHWHGGPITTQALGEEGTRGPLYPPRPPRHGPYTTYALGEEGSWTRPRPPHYTTFALGEEGRGPGGSPHPPRFTTYAVGEEGRW